MCISVNLRDIKETDRDFTMGDNPERRPSNKAVAVLPYFIECFSDSIGRACLNGIVMHESVECLMNSADIRDENGNVHPVERSGPSC